MKRQNNEDNYLINDDLRLYVVADGMGGHAGGEFASQIAVTTVEEVIANIREQRDQEPSERSRDVTVEEKIKYAIRLAGKRIYDEAQRDPSRRGMGTTAVVLVLHHGKAYVGHVGDSRAYMVRDDECQQLTDDHSLVNEQIKAGLITKESAKHHKLRNIITRSLGYQEEVEIDVQNLSVQPGDLFLMCSDGLSNLVEDHEMGELVANRPFQQAAMEMVALANKRGGDDNITLVAARVDAV